MSSSLYTVKEQTETVPKERYMRKVCQGWVEKELFAITLDMILEYSQIISRNFCILRHVLQVKN